MNHLNAKLNVQEIIKKLTQSSKPNFTKISKELNISRKTFFNYFDRLKEEEIINNFTINVNPNVLNPNLKYVIMEIKTNPKEPKLIERFLSIPQLIMLDGILGEFSLFALFIFRDSFEFNEILKELDKIMAESYFKKYQIIETIKVFKTNGIDISSLNKMEKEAIDEIDEEILKILRREQKGTLISTYEISKLLAKKKNLRISQSTIYNRIKLLEKKGIILNHAINFNPKKLGFKGKYIVRIKPKDPSEYDKLALNLVKKREITDLFRIGEQYGLFAIVRVKEIEDYGKFIKNLYESEEIENTFTNFVLDERISWTNFVLY